MRNARATLRPSVEELESRLCLSLTYSVVNGSLTISGTPLAGPSGQLLIQESATVPNKFTIQDTGGSSTVALNASHSINLNLTSFDTPINFDLNGNNYTGNLLINLGRGSPPGSSLPVSLYNSGVGGGFLGAM